MLRGGAGAPLAAPSSNCAFSSSVWLRARAASRPDTWPLVWLRPTMMLSRFRSATASFFSRSCAPQPCILPCAKTYVLG